MKKTICVLALSLIAALSGCQRSTPNPVEYENRVHMELPGNVMLLFDKDDKGKITRVRSFQGQYSGSCFYAPGNKDQCVGFSPVFPMDTKMELSVQQALQWYNALQYDIHRVRFESKNKDQKVK